MHYGGETAYHSNFLGVATQTAPPTCLKKFLDGDAAEELQKHTCRRLADLRKSRQAYVKQQAILISNVETTMRLLENRRYGN